MEIEPEPKEVNDSPTESKVDNTRNIIVYGNYNENIQGNYNQNNSSSEQTQGNQLHNQNTPCNIKRTGSTNFVGRTEKLEELHQLLQQNESHTIHYRDKYLLLA